MRSGGVGALGVNDTQTREPVTADTVFEAASLSKPVFAYAVLKLVEKGMIDLDKPMAELVNKSYIQKKFSQSITQDQRLDLITPRMIFSHSGGFPNWRQGDLNILFNPGEKFQ
jgi:CubicO group peptidase (beta-lactamase class C family)